MPVVLRAKCIVVGDSAVGKTALLQSYQNDGSQFAKNYNMTAGVSITVKAVPIPESEDVVEFYLYDSAGKELYSEFAQTFWDHPGVVMVMYSVTDDQSFNSCSKWLERVKAQRPTPELPLPGALVANKIDLKARRVVDEDRGREWATSRELEYFECSSKDQVDVEKPFVHLAQQFYSLYKTKSETLKGWS